MAADHGIVHGRGLRIGLVLRLVLEQGHETEVDVAWLSDLSGLPSKPSGIEVQKARPDR
jgi:predicted choloylglycine hydrolase